MATLIAIAGATGQVGRPLCATARAGGHGVLELSRSNGVDLTSGEGLDLSGVDAVIDVTNSASTEEGPATEFFTTVAANLGDAARAAGVERSVLLSIIGVDRTPQDGYFVAKLAGERAAAEHAPGLAILRAAQFHDFAGQMLGWNRDGDAAEIPDQPIQPVAIPEVVRVLLDLAVADEAPALTEVAGPRPERLPDMVARLAPDVAVTSVPVSTAVAEGALRPGPGAIVAGPDFGTWLAAR